MIKDAGVSEGLWALTANFAFSQHNFGPDDQHMNPGSIVVLMGLQIQREMSGTMQPFNLLVDAAEVNPPTQNGDNEAPKTTQRSHSKR